MLSDIDVYQIAKLQMTVPDISTIECAVDDDDDMTPVEFDRAEKPVCEFIHVSDTTLEALSVDSDDISSQFDKSVETERQPFCPVGVNGLEARHNSVESVKEPTG